MSAFEVLVKVLKCDTKISFLYETEFWAMKNQRENKISMVKMRIL